MALSFQFLKLYGPRIATAIIILLLGIVIGRWVARLLTPSLERKQLEPPVRMLILRIFRLLVLAFAALLATQNLGVEIMPLVAGLGVAGVGLGLAMQGVLSNLVAGLTIIFTKPFRVGEYIEVLGVHGQVESIELFSTTLMHVDLSRVIIPNRKIVGEILHNYRTTRQLDLSVRLTYGTNIDAALVVVREILNGNPRVLKQPAPAIGVAMLGNYSIRLSIQPWVAVTDYRSAQTELNQAILEHFRAHRIEIAVLQREIRVIGVSGQPTA
ncbi:MAG: mechanosensitive ion channel [Pedosphaera sp.]|nr:mechanosensitive ion channel [Pedosphaera sp.]